MHMYESRNLLTVTKDDYLTDDELGLLWMMLKQIDESYAFVIKAKGVVHNMAKKDGAYYVYSDQLPDLGMSNNAYELIDVNGVVRGIDFQGQAKIAHSPTMFLFKALKLNCDVLAYAYTVKDYCVERNLTRSTEWDCFTLVSKVRHSLDSVDEIRKYL